MLPAGVTQPPGDSDAWYAPHVRSHDEIHPGVVVTVRDARQEFVYDVREPDLTETDVDALERVEEYFESAHIEPPVGERNEVGTED